MPDAAPLRSTRRRLLQGGTAALAVAVVRPGASRAQSATPVAGADPLPSWNEGPVKQRLVAFVAAANDPASPSYVPPEQRVATFDADGTLWCEWPASAATFFALDRARALAESDPEYARDPVLRDLLAGGFDDLQTVDLHKLYAVSALANADTTQQFVIAAARRWLQTAVNPATGRRWVDQVYQPQLELLAWLRDTGWTSFVVSGTPIDILRAFAPQVLGVPPWRVVGTSYDYGFATVNGDGQVVTSAALDAADVGIDKATAIALHIGLRPVLAAGNSDGDLEMLQYALGGPQPGLALLVHHTDAKREFAYDRDYRFSPCVVALDTAAKEGFVVVDMARDWAAIWPAAPSPSLLTG